MIYIVLIGIIFLVFLLLSIVNKLGAISNLIASWHAKAEVFKDEINQIHQSIDSINSKLMFPPKNKMIVPFKDEEKYRPYMSIMYGYVEQTKMFSFGQILYQAGTLPTKNIEEHIKKHYLLMFAHMMSENNLQFSDFKINSSYGGNGPSEHFYVRFKLRNMKYYGWDEWVSKAILSIEMQNGEIKEFAVKSYVNNLEQYFELEDEYQSVHFFDALAKAYPKFVFDDETYRSINGFSNEDYIVVLNDLVHLYNTAGKEWNVVFADSFSTVLDLEWTGKLEDLWNKTRVIDSSWNIGESIIQVLNQEALGENRKKLFDAIVQSQNENDQFKLASMYYYDQTNHGDLEGTNQKKAIEIWHILADKNHAFAQLVLGMIYFDGLYVLKDFQKSKAYIQSAFENGFEKPALKVWDDLQLYNY